MRDRGTFNFSGNLEVKKDAPLEARSLVNSYADLVKPETWTDEQGGIWKYDCMLVSCKDRPGKVYQLSPGADYTKESSWILIGDTSELNNKVQEFIDSKGAPNGLASLNESGIIPSAQLPSYSIILPSDKSKIDKIITNGNGTKYLSDNGTYKEVQGGSADIESLKQYVNDSISSARSVGYMMQLTEIDASGLDENTWYPVTIAAGERMNIRVEVLVSSGTKPSWSTHERGFSTRKIWEFAPNAWGVNRDSKTTIYLSDFIHADIDPVRGLGNLSHFDTCYVFVRGGGKYHFYASHEAKVILHTGTYIAGDQSVSPTTAEIVANIATKGYADNIGYGKVIDVDGNDSINNINAQGAEAENRINRLFGSINSFKNVVIDIVNSHAKYHFHLFNLTSNCIEMGSVFAYVSSSENNRYLLSFIFTYLDYCKHCKIDVTDVSKEVIIKDLVASDNLTTLTKKTAAEYEAIGSKDANTAYCVTD